MIEHAISVTEASRHLSDVVERTRRRRVSTLLLKRGRPVARIVPVPIRARSGGELARRWSSLPHLSAAEAKAFDRELTASRRRLPMPRSAWE